MALVVQFLMLLLAVGVSHGQYKSCPPPEDISPCTCQKALFGIEEEVVCNKVDDVEKVRKALQSVKGIRKLAFISSKLGVVPSDLFKGLHVTDLSFDYCDLQGIGNEGRSALEGLEDTVENFRVQSSFSEPRLINVSGLHQLRSLAVKFNKMRGELGNEWLAEGPANLRIVDFVGNKMEGLGDRAFASLANIGEVWLSHNKIRTLQRSMFPASALHFEWLFLNNNEISSLPDDIFSNMPALKHVHLDRNSLQQIPETTWAPVWSSLDSLDLRYNPLICDSNIDWTFKVRRPKGKLQATCDSPEERKGLDLKELIEDNQKGN